MFWEYAICRGVRFFFFDLTKRKSAFVRSGAWQIFCTPSRLLGKPRKYKTDPITTDYSTTHYLPGYSAHILTYAYVFGYFPYVDTGVGVPQSSRVLSTLALFSYDRIPTGLPEKVWHLRNHSSPSKLVRAYSTRVNNISI